MEEDFTWADVDLSILENDWRWRDLVENAVKKALMEIIPDLPEEQVPIAAARFGLDVPFPILMQALQRWKRVND